MVNLHRNVLEINATLQLTILVFANSGLWYAVFQYNAICIHGQYTYQYIGRLKLFPHRGMILVFRLC